MKKVILAAAMAVISMSAFAGLIPKIYGTEGTLTSSYSRGSSNVSTTYENIKERIFNSTAWQVLNFSGKVECSGGGGGSERFAYVRVGYNNRHSDPYNFRGVFSLINKPYDNVGIWGYASANIGDFDHNTVNIQFSEQSQIWCSTWVKMPQGEWGTLKAVVSYTILSFASIQYEDI